MNRISYHHLSLREPRSILASYFHFILLFQAPGTDHPALFFDTVFTQPAHWINKPPEELLQNNTCEVGFKFQHVHLPLVKCELTLFGANGLMASLEHPMRALTPGQYAVFYKGEVCLGSAKIIKQGPSLYDMNVREPVKIPAGLT